MLSRTSIVDHLHVDTTIFSSVVQIGDSKFIQGFSRALADQRETDVFFGNEGSFEAFYAFTKPIPIPPINDYVAMQTTNLCPAIKVNNIFINGVSTTGIVHIGSSQHISLEARIKHIRELLPR
ncbi:spore germination protein GerPE [Bacillus sp. S/N-304-OC-R1]|uniref:spore germination protein GerPE n=1 Tax=Bacillus sp. S/N-304-OC-R1 TaxID=2758034 RepID=UPI001C8EC42B|nr:spore germination protein GerPE [Bacillus sp. S/N-304-OC-R1]MBY0121075.1 spore germination protein GerPE [Bacillus sp. S/N-304-OC-R1]